MTKSVKAFLNFGAGLIRGRGATPNDTTGNTEPQLQRIEQLRQRVKKLEQENAELRGRLAAGSVVDPNNIIWVFGAGRTGSTWLAAMMEEMENQTIWFEPRVGELFDPERMQVDQRRGKPFILADQYRNVWLRSIRNFVLDGANARFPEVGERGLLVVKDPAGSVGAPLLMESMPQSRLILLIRDPRDVAASWQDAHRKGSWLPKQRRLGESASKRLTEWQLGNLLEIMAKRYLKNVSQSKKAYEAHKGRKVLVKYEDLLVDTLSTMRHVYSELGVQVEEKELARSVEKHSWENIPKEQKGEGKFYRKANPGGWREDLTSEQAKVVEKITAPLLKEFYPD